MVLDSISVNNLRLPHTEMPRFTSLPHTLHTHVCLCACMVRGHAHSFRFCVGKTYGESITNQQSWCMKIPKICHTVRAALKMLKNLIDHRCPSSTSRADTKLSINLIALWTFQSTSVHSWATQGGWNTHEFVFNVVKWSTHKRIQGEQRAHQFHEP